jgi:hypothetical protein
VPKFGMVLVFSLVKTEENCSFKSSALTPSLTLIFQTSLERGKVPDDWKTAHVTPIFKKGDKSKPSNYRPVSLTSTCCKTLEHIIFSHRCLKD